MNRYLVRMKNGSKANGFVGVSCVTTKSSLFSSRLSAPRMSSSGKRFGIDRRAQVDTEVLDRGLRLRIDDGSVERLFGNLKIGLHQQWRQLQRVLVVHESVFGDGVRGKRLRQIVVQQQQLAQGVAILRDGQAPDQAVLRRRTQARNFQRLRDPLDHPLALGAGRLRLALRRHGPVADLFPYGSQSRRCRSSSAASSWSTRTPDVLRSALWQRTQFCFKNGFTCWSNDGSSAFGAPSAA